MGGLGTGAQSAGARLEVFSRTNPGALTGQNINRKFPDCVAPSAGGGLTVNTALELRMELTGLDTSTV